VWWSDERCVEPDDERSNYRLANASLLKRLHHRPRVHRIRGELQRDAAAAEYERELTDTRLDLSLLGIGPDGHVASLFPNALSLQERDRRVLGVSAGFEPYVDRVTFTLPQLNAATAVVFLVTGGAKADAVRRAFGEDPGPQTPSSLVRGKERTLVVLDAAAAAGLDL
jgi:6-phosphogluconolactonase